ncbi:hypothetical protein AB8O38_06105 [Saccharomonospora xinjiangensis]|uniref:hypothetical protein n=1 Tax=Saccharomonospora xinjiangensis TaxID=75294 RepID=UPI00350F9CDD
MASKGKRTRVTDAEYAVYRIHPDRGYARRSTPEVRQALQTLVDALNALPNPFEACIADLTVDDLSLALNSLDLHHRKLFFQAVGKNLQPHGVVPKAMCVDALGHLKKVTGGTARRALHALASGVQSTLKAQTYPDLPSSASAPPLSRWSEPLLRAGIWAYTESSVMDSRGILWAAQHDWFPPNGFSADHVAPVVKAAQGIVDLTPDYTPVPPQVAGAEAEGAALPEHDTAQDSSPTEHNEAKTLDGPEDSTPGSVTNVETTVFQDVTTQTLATVEMLEEDIVRARDLLSVVRSEVLERIADELTREAPPSRADITTLSELADTFDQLRAALTLIPGALADPNSPIRSLGECEEAVARLRNAQARATLLEPIKRLREAEYIGGANASIADQLAALSSHAGELISSDDPDTAEAEALCQLVELIDVQSQPHAADPQRMLTLQRNVVTVYPEHAALIMAAVMGQLTWKTRRQDSLQKPAESAPEMIASHSEVPRIAGDTEDAIDPTIPTGHKVTGIDVDSPETESPPPSPKANQHSKPTVIDRSSLDGATEQEAEKLTEVADTEVVLARLLEQQRYSAALAVATARNAPSAHLSALRLAGLAAAVRSDTGDVAARIRAELTTLAANPGQFQRDADTFALLLSVPALVRIAFVVGEPLAGPLLQEVRASVVSPLGKIVEDIAQHSVRNLFASGALRAVRADAKTLNEQATAAREAAEAVRSRPRSLRWKRATDVASNWLSPTGMLGSLLKIVAEDRRTDVAVIVAEVARLANNAEVEREISSAEKRSRRNARRPLEGAARRALAELVKEALTPLSNWAHAALALHRESGGSSTERWASAELANLRAVIKSKRDSVSTSMANTYAQQAPQIAAAAQAGLASLNESFDFALSGTGMDGPEPISELAAELEFLRVPGIRVGDTVGEVAFPPGTAATDVARAMGTPWGAVFATHLAAENFPAAIALSACREHLFGATDGVSEQALENAVRTSRNKLNNKHEELSAALRRARRQNELSEEQDADLSEKLSAHDPHDEDRMDLATIRRHLDTVSEELPSYRDEAITRLKARFDKIAFPSQADSDIIMNLLDQGELSVAEELIYFLESGESLPKHRARTDFADFFPSVPAALPNGLTKRLITAVSKGRRVPDTPLDFSTLSAEARTTTADALKNWSTISGAAPEMRHKLAENAAVELKPIMRILGYEFQSAHRLSRLSRGADYRFLELTNVRVTGRALVPAFGSRLDGHLRVMLVWGKPGPEQLMSWADHDARNGSLVVLHFGTLSAKSRRSLARRAGQTSAPVVVIDDAALAYLAAAGEGQLDATMSISLPFAAVNPYTNVRRGLVAPEMFYGRNQERRDVLDPHSSQVLYGGRGLGKSALLRASAERFEAADHRRIAIYLDLNTIGFGAGQPATVVWDALLQSLRDRDVLVPRGKGRQADSYKVVSTGIGEWLKNDPQNELLILLDEADRFFDADAESPVFRETSRLKALSGIDGAANRVKVVFAGLHTVQRFAKASTNGPFSHLGAPIVIGPLSPQSAYDLVATPMGALGFEFENTDLINGILAYCSYQPFLLQMFCHRLVRVMLDRRIHQMEEQEPPYLISRADIDAIERDVELQERIEAAFTDTLHLDARYNVIACVIAHNAHANGLDARLTDLELRRDCTAYWEEGFAEVDAERFRAYLEEMVGLGVLAPRNARGWRLRSPNTLRMIGNENAVLEKLVTAAEESVPEDFITLESRHPLSDGKPSPLTAAQLADLLGNHRNQTRLIIGSSATGIDFVPAAIRMACTNFGDTIALVEPSSHKEFREELLKGQPGERRVIFSDLRNTSEQACRDSVKQAISQLPTTQGVTRSVVLVASPEQLNWWGDELMRHNDELSTVTLNRYTQRTLKVWTLNNDKFTSPDRLNQLFTVTGGWPSIVSKAAELAASQNEDKALQALGAWVKSPEGASEFVESTGIDSDPDLAAVFDGLGALVTEQVSIDEMLDAIEMIEYPHPEKAYAVLNALGAFNIDKGLVIPDPFLVSLRHMGSPA